MDFISALRQVTSAIRTWVDDNKVDKISGKGLSTNDFTTEEKERLASLDAKVAGIVSVEAYAHLVIDDDWTAAVQTAIDECGTIYINKDINIYGTVTMGIAHAIILGACVITKPDSCGNTDPIFWFNNVNSAIYGCGQKASRIVSNVSSPSGVIKIGHPSSTEATRTVTYCTLNNVMVKGALKSDENKGIYLCAPLINQMASYFHNISNCVISTCGYGIYFDGDANANMINNIHFYQVGSENGGGLYFHHNLTSACDNNISNIFHHKSPDAKTVVIDGNIKYNSITNIISEPSGSSYCIYVTDNGATAELNTISIQDNTSMGNRFPQDFIDNNTIIRNRAVSTVTVKSKVVNSKQIKTPYSRVLDITSTNPIGENQTIPLLSIDSSVNSASGIPIGRMYHRISIYVQVYPRTYAASLVAYADREYVVYCNNDEYTVEETKNGGTLGLTWDGNTLSLKTKNNGTSVTSNYNIHIEIIGSIAQDGCVVVNSEYFQEA